MPKHEITLLTFAVLTCSTFGYLLDEQQGSRLIA